MGKKKTASLIGAAAIGIGSAVLISQGKLGGGGNQDPSQDPINANISANKRQIIVGETINFTANPTGGDGKYNVNWAFGDGRSASGLNVSHKYNNAGEYTVSATARDGSGRTITEFINISVGTENNPPPPPPPDPEPIPDVIQGFNVVPTKGDVPLVVNASVSVGDSRSSVAINWGDGEVTNNQLDVSHTYFSKGTYTVKVTVTASDGRTASRSQSVSVTEEPTTSGLISNFAPPSSSGAEGLTEFTSSIALGVSADKVEILWDWGDGFTEINTLNSSHIYTQGGTYTGSVMVTHDDGRVDSKSFTIKVTGSAGAPNGEIVPTGKSENVYTFFANFQGQSLTFEWDFGDGTPIETTTQNEISHAFNKVGTFTVKCTAIDINGETGSDTVQVSIRETDLQAELGDAQIQRLSNTTFDYSWKIVNVTERFLDLEYTLRVFDQVGSQKDSRIRQFGLQGFESKNVDYNVPSLADGIYNLELEVQDVNTKQLVAFESLTIEVTSDDPVPEPDPEPQEAQRGSIVVIEKSLSQVDFNTARMIVTIGNNNDFPVNGTLELFPEFINPDGTIVNLADQVKAAPLAANQKDRILFQWDPLFGFELQSGKLRVGVNYRDSNGNFLVSGQPTSQITIT